jgi:hypothetical protein
MTGTWVAHTILSNPQRIAVAKLMAWATLNGQS